MVDEDGDDKKGEDVGAYDEMISLLDKEFNFLESQESTVVKELETLEAQEAKLGQAARQTLENAQRSHM